MPYCSALDCWRLAGKGRAGLCEGCYRNKYRPRVKAVPSRGARYESPRARFIEAALALADADAEDENAWESALERARKAARAWLKG